MKTYKTSTPEFKDSVEIIETTDTNHADNVTAADIQNFQDNDDYTVDIASGVRCGFAWMNFDGVLGNKTLRQAIDNGKLTIRDDMASVSGETLSLSFA